ncbi:MAG TPA: hypothetical protein VJN70_09095 [Gemmatimonadaceae bacterium]|nr:hypothetical protein [Gemmatimonadaceae bacterium]
MSNHRSISSLTLLLGIIVAACSSGKPVMKDTAHGSPVLERHALDLDGDSVPDSILIFRGDSSHPGVAGKIELRMSRAGTRVLQDSNRYDPAPEEFNGFGNLLTSRIVYAADFYRAGRLVLLFGAKTGCCQQSLTIYRVGSNGPQEYFRDPELFIDRSPVPQPNKIALLAGRKLSQAVAPPSSEYVSAVTYAPVIVYRLEDAPRIDSAATRTLTREELGGFAGFGYRTDVAALRRGNGSKLLWSRRDHRPVP